MQYRLLQIFWNYAIIQLLNETWLYRSSVQHGPTVTAVLYGSTVKLHWCFSSFINWLIIITEIRLLLNIDAYKCSIAYMQPKSMLGLNLYFNILNLWRRLCHSARYGNRLKMYRGCILNAKISTWPPLRGRWFKPIFFCFCIL